MKKLFIALAIIVVSRSAFAQKEQVTLDEHNKYIYYQVVDMPGLSADTMYHRCAANLKKICPKPLGKPVMVAGTSIDLKTKFMLYSSMTYVKHEEGEVTCALHMEFKDGKYRYWLTDLEFAPYVRNRYGVYERAHEDPATFEQLKSKKDDRIFGNYLEQIAVTGKQTGADMRSAIEFVPKKVVQPVKIDTKKW